MVQANQGKQQQQMTESLEVKPKKHSHNSLVEEHIENRNIEAIPGAAKLSSVVRIRRPDWTLQEISG